MMVQKLPTFLKENSAKLLIKYDGERCVKKYTVRLLYRDIMKFKEYDTVRIMKDCEEGAKKAKLVTISPAKGK